MSIKIQGSVEIVDKIAFSLHNGLVNIGQNNVF